MSSCVDRSSRLCIIVMRVVCQSLFRCGVEKLCVPGPLEYLMLRRSEAQLNQSDAGRRYALLFLTWPGSGRVQITKHHWFQIGRSDPCSTIGQCGPFSGPVLSSGHAVGPSSRPNPRPYTTHISRWFSSDCFLRFSCLPYTYA